MIFSFIASENNNCLKVSVICMYVVMMLTNKYTKPQPCMHELNKHGKNETGFETKFLTYFSFVSQLLQMDNITSSMQAVILSNKFRFPKKVVFINVVFRRSL